jgi:dipeptidyl aminopeptidase/acylaminoacyl peptidase
MIEKQIAQYGSWPSPISSDLVVKGTVRLKIPIFDAGKLYWTEMRPSEAGRSVIVEYLTDGKTQDIIPPRVHEYGGGESLITEGKVYFINFSDQKLYLVDTNKDKMPQIIPTKNNCYYSDFVLDKHNNRLICIQEDHSNSDQEAINSLVAINLTGSNAIEILAIGNDFYSSPRLSPDGTKLAWLTWQHPNMPWDATELWVGEINKQGEITNLIKIAGGKTESIFQPEWSASNTLYFVSDRNNWWNLYCWQNGQIEALYEKEAEFGLPQWVFGMKTYGFLSDNTIICTYTEKGVWHLASLNLETKELKNFDIPYTEISDLHIADEKAFFVAGSPTKLREIAVLNLFTGKIKVLRKTSDLVLDHDYLSTPQTVEFPTENGLTAHAFYYPPKNAKYQALAEEKPPLLVKSHGGPTAATSSVLSLTIQYWTSRGFAVLDVNYGGSTGYGRDYRSRLNKNWGIIDVDDCVNAAKYLVKQGLADAKKLAIDGGSAGGYTTLSVLTFRDVFSAGASYYGVSDLKALAEDTHKFESRYLDNLVGAYPQEKELYHQRSPINFVEQLSCPVILLQGLEDKVVPPNQAEKMLEALREKKIPVAYVAFEGEQHGFRQAANIKRALEAEYYFYSQVFKFPVVDDITPVKIENSEKL